MRSLRVMSRLTAAAAAVLCSVALAGCHSDKQQAAAVTGQFMDAMKTGNTAQLKSLLTKKSVEKWNDEFGKSMTSQTTQDGEYKLGDAEITDDTAAVPVTITSTKHPAPQTIKIKLRKEDGQWKVYAMSFATPGGPEMTMDFENPEAFLQDLMKAMGGALQKMGSGMQGGGGGAGFGR